MVSPAVKMPQILTATEADIQRADARAAANARLAENQMNSSAQARGSGSAVAYAIAALVLLVAGYLWFNGNSNMMMLFPSVSETVPSPDINSTVPPVPSAPPPADNPATNP